jgi:hypothetical protein
MLYTHILVILLSPHIISLFELEMETQDIHRVYCGEPSPKFNKWTFKFNIESSLDLTLYFQDILN